MHHALREAINCKQYQSGESVLVESFTLLDLRNFQGLVDEVEGEVDHCELDYDQGSEPYDIFCV